MTVNLKTPEDIDSMRVAGQLAADVLEMIGRTCKTGHYHRRAGPHLPRLHRQRAEGHPGAAELQGLPEVDLHLDQPCGLPRHPERQAAEKRRHPEHRRHRDQGRLPRRHQQDVPCRQSAESGRAPLADHPGMPLQRHRNGQTGRHLGDIGEVIQKHAEKNGFSVVREYCGHGIGKVFHEEPQVLHYGRAGTGMELKEGMTFTIEPMINQGKADTRLLGDGWTAITKDRKLSAQWEHTILVTATGYEIFTLRSDDTIARTSA